MAVMKLNFLSRELGIHTKVSVILPTGRPRIGEKREKCLYQVLWLLPGGSDDTNDFILNTNIARYAEDYMVAVVVPEAHNAFYTDEYLSNGARYFSYLTEELPRMLRSILPLSEKREDNFVAGNSMGSGGAMKCAVLHPEMYAAALMMSGAGMRMHRAEDAWVSDFCRDVAAGKDISGYPAPEDPKKDVWMAVPIYRALKEKTDLPELFFTCGSEDGLLKDIRTAFPFYEKMGMKFFYEEVPGYRHEWDFWDLSLRKALREWLPLRHALIPVKEEV